MVSNYKYMITINPATSDAPKGLRTFRFLLARRDGDYNPRAACLIARRLVWR